MTVVGHDGKSPAPEPNEVFTPEQWDSYFAMIGQNIGPDIAARDLGLTGSKMRALIRRDPVYQARFDEAREEGAEHYADRLKSQARLLAMDRDKPSERLLEVELGTHVPEYAHLRRDRMKVEGKIEHAIVLPEGWIEGAPVEVLEWLAGLDGGGVVEEGEFRELGPGETT